MKKILFFCLAAVSLMGCKSSSSTAQKISGSQAEAWQILVVDQLESSIDQDIVKVKYANGSTLYYRIIDHFGNVAITWDRSNSRASFYDGKSGYKGKIEIPSFVTVGENDEFVFRVQDIDDNAFYGCDELAEVTIPYSVGRIHPDAFRDCKSLKSIKVSPYNSTYIDMDGILFSKDKKMLVQCPAKKVVGDYVIPSEVTLICTGAFKDNHSLTSVTVGNEVTVISDYAFMNCTELNTLRLGLNVRVLGASSFKGCEKIAEIFSPNVFPPHNSPTVFEDAIKGSCKVYVIKGQKNNYQRRLEWSEFKNWEEQNFSF